MMLLGIEVPTWLLVIVLIISVIYKYITWNFGIFRSLDIPYESGFSSYFNAAKQGVVTTDTENCQKHGKFWGSFMGRRPMLMVADVDMLKEIYVKQFRNFPNRHNIVLNENPLNKMLFLLKDDHWRGVRNLLSPAYSTGKLKQMMYHLNDCGRHFASRMEEIAEKNEIIEFKKHAGYYTMDAIAGTGFGIKIDSETEDTQFVKMVKTFSEGSFTTPIIVVAIFLPFMQIILQAFGVKFLKKDVEAFFRNIVKQSIEQRQADKMQHRDLLQMMINACAEDKEEIPEEELENMKISSKAKSSKTSLTEDEMVGQTLLFFLAGFDTTATSIAFLGYNLACNPECQEKVIEEIDSLCPDGTLPQYEMIQKMEYLDMCLQESLRLYPPANRTDRQCSHETVVNGVRIPKGIEIGIPIHLIHHDPEVWPDPYKFKPERFTPEEKASRDPYHWQPFGIGPRSCVGNRLGLLETKMAIVHLLQRLTIKTCPQTEIPVKMKNMKTDAVNGLMLTFEKRI